ncbi:MAG: PadR family transcriptional regulator [Actinomycetes bacterium]|jgi:PadR family transcriptional regulator PadR|nr:MAG: PadR family transcriptional regulator [Actinomycetota bacterium]
MVSGGTRQDRSSQLLHGVLDMCLMAVIREEPSYGYEMASKLTERGLGLASEGSIYPILSRLQRSGLIEGYLVQSSEGPARKYYRITDKGRKSLEEWVGVWKSFRTAVDLVIGGDDAD